MAGTDTVLNLKINTIMDVSDVKHNVDEIQKSFGKLKLPDKLGDSLKKNISDFNKEYEKYQKKVAEGIHTQGDKNSVNKSLNSMLNSYEKIINEFSKMSKKDFKDIFNLDTGAFEKIQTKIKQIQTEIKKIKLDPKGITEPINQIRKLTSAKSLFGEGKGLNKLTEAFKTNDLIKAKEAIKEVDNYLAKFGSRMKPDNLKAFKAAFDPLKQKVLEADKAAEGLFVDLDKVNGELNEAGAKGSREFQGIAEDLNRTKASAENLTEELKRQHEQEFNFNNEVKNIDRQIQSYFGLSQIIRKVGNIARDAFSTVKELDAAMVETAVVTNFDVGDMWDMLPMYTENANALGSTIKDVYEAATLYYQQGLNQAQAMGLANETLKMARIGGLEAAEATDMMTAALRGFNMQINELSAQRINDVYSELAAITASNTKEIGSAMERTASIANSANMEFETTSAFLAQMIETTREAPENLGTAMKTIIARFQEMKQDPTKLMDSEGVMMDANRVDTALKTIGVNLMNAKGEFRDLDDVFLDIAAKWDSLTQGQQRYIATIAAGSRQQSRFIAMMSNYDRTMELVEAANNSAGASQRQFEKTLEGMDAKLNKLQNAWNQFAMGLMNNQIIKFGVDALTKALDLINKIINALGGHLPDPFGGLVKSALTLVATFSGLNLAKKGVNGLVGGIIGWGKNETGKGLFGSIVQGFSDQRNVSVAKNSGKTAGKAYGQGIQLGLRTTPIRQTLTEMFSKTARSSHLLNNLIPPGAVDSAARQDATQYLLTISREINSHKMTNDQAKVALQSGLSNYYSNIDVDSIDDNFVKKVGNLGALEKQKSKIEGFGKTIDQAGLSLTYFGSLLQNTPFAPFGSALMAVGTAFNYFGGALSTVKTNLLANIAVQAGEITSLEGLTAAELQSAAAAGSTALANATLGASIKLVGSAILSTLGPILLIVGAVAALVFIYKKLDDAIVTNKERLETASAAAGAAGDAYSSAKQATSELADNINRIKEADAGFDGLVAGTAAFNEQLVESNQLILDLINKYPMLNDYLTVDKNGRMKISDEGMEAVTEYQKQAQAQAAALSVEKNAALEAEKTRQEIEKLRGDQTVTIREHGEEYTYTYAKELTDEEQKQLDILEKQYESQKQSAALNSARTIISGKELSNQEAVASLYASQYETLKKQVTLGSKKENYEKYAEFYGYSYEGGKLLDVEGNEVNVDYDEIKDAIPDITVMMDFEANAESVDDAIASVNDLFAEELESGTPGRGTFISDVLSNNIEANEDLIQSILKDDSEVVAAVKAMSEENLATLLNKDKTYVKEHLDEAQQELIDLIHNNAVNIGQAQAEEYTDLATMMSEAQYSSQSKYRKSVAPDSSVVKDVTKQLEALTAEQRRSILKAGQGLQEAAGRDSMRIIVGGMTELYNKVNTATGDALNEANAAAREMQDIVDNVNWSSATDRLSAYKQMVQSTNVDVQNLGNNLLDSTDSANLLGEAFEEVYDSQDFQDILEDLDKYTDASGNIDASGITEMAKESRSLNNLLETGAITAGGFALAFNTLHGAGDVTLLNLNQDVLTLLSSFAQLDSVMASAHNTVENFDAGIDTGEGEDFIKDAVEKYNEFRDNGEWGNPQMEAYAKLIVGEDRWLDALKENNGNLEETFEDFDNKIQLFSDGYYDAWAKLANSEKLDPKGIISWGEDGEINLKVDDMSTDEVVEYLQDNLKISKEAAELMLTDFENYSADLRAELQATDFIKGFKEAGYVENRTGENGQIVLTLSEIQTIGAALGKDEDEIKEQIAEAAHVDVSQLEILTNIDDKGNLVTDWDSLMEEYAQKFIGKDAGQYDWIKEYEEEGAYQIKDAIEGLKSDGLVDEQAMHMAYETFKELGENQEFEYEGQLLKPEDINSYEDFVAAIEEFSENSQWVQVGEAIAEGYMGYIAAHDKDGDGKPDKNTYGTSEEVRKNAQADVDSGKVSRGGQGVGKNTQSQEVEQEIKKEREEKTTQLVEIQTKLNEEGFTDASQKVEEFKDEVAKNPGEIGIETKQIKPTKLEEYIHTVENSHPEVTVLENTDYVYLETDRAIQYINKQTGKVTVVAKGFSTIYDEIDRIKSSIEANPINVKVRTRPSGAAEAYTGLNNKISYTHVPEAGSLAKGTKKGKVGPRNQGGLTLTGEEGYEVAWIPSQSKSVILGANGPQMVNLPKEAVVYNHEQSKDILKNRKSISAGSLAKGYKNRKTEETETETTTTSSSDGKTKTTKETEKVKVYNNFSIEEVYRFEVENKIKNYQNQIDKWGKKFNDLIDKAGTRLSKVTGLLKNQRKALEQIEKENKNLASSYKKDLNKLADKSYKTKISYTPNGGTENKEQTIDLSKFIYHNKKTGKYGISKDAIKRASNGDPAKQEAIFKAAESALNPLLSGLESAQKAADSAREELDELSRKTYEAFYGWKNEITKIYNLTQKLEQGGQLRDRYEAQMNLDLARVSAGFSSVSKATKDLIKASALSDKALRTNIRNSYEMIQARGAELDAALSYKDELATYNEVKKKNLGSGANAAAKEELDITKTALKYVSGIRKFDDGHVEYNIDWEKFKENQKADPKNKEFYDRVKEKLDDINNAASEYNQAIQDATTTLATVYEELRGYQETIADMEDTLLKQLQEDLKKQIDNAKTLNTSLTNALKSMLDQVKKRLDQRRQAEDNAKTESEIAQKQQRLNYLRANTAGGNQVEIAQLEKEIGESQQSYQRTLEDQMLNKLQEQGDAAAAQRERQIAIAEAQMELSRSSNAELVAMWLKDPVKYKEQIRDALLEAQGYDEKGEMGKALSNQDTDKAISELSQALFQTQYSKVFNDMAEDVGPSLSYIAKQLEGIVPSSETNGETLKEILTAITKDNTNGDKNVKGTLKAYANTGKSIKAGVSAAQQIDKDFKPTIKGLHQAGWNYEAIRKYGYSAEDFVKAGIKDVKTLRGAGFSDSQISKAGVKIPSKIGSKAKKKVESSKKTTTTKKATSSKKTYAQHGGSLPSSWPGYFSESYTKSIQKFLKAIGLYKDSVDGSYGPNTRAATVAFQKKVKLNPDGSFGPDTLKKAKLYKYKKGGLASFTGPAWLDGTPSKPEIVLNSTDTKNFVQLKDILASVMKGGAFDTPIAAAGDTTYEININVDHLNNDYDVDKVADRVKKLIVKDSSYRNVTSVRKFR